ncbi:hypothetical protein [Escherichia coli]|uniref:hypothetical protein n=1 Tax=Escherichia coli TaxID=562 RepID=UPI003AFB29BD
MNRTAIVTVGGKTILRFPPVATVAPSSSVTGTPSREIHRLEPEESCCPECGGELDYLGKSALEQLELVSSA